MKRFFFLIILLFSSKVFAEGTCNCNKPLADIVAPLLPAVVNVSVTQKNILAGAKRFKNIFPDDFPFAEFFEKFGVPGIEQDDMEGASQLSASGSGFIIDPTGFIVTNHHVIADADKISVKLSDGTELEASLVGSDSKTDLALLKVKASQSLSYVKFGNSDIVRSGDSVVTIGNPFGLGGTVTAGIISAPTRDINSGTLVDNFIQTDASVNQGNSGGPLFNMNGEVIGINTAIVSPSGGNVGIAFAVPASFASPIIEQIKSGGKVKRGWLGVVMRQASNFAESMGIEENTGAEVVSVFKNSPAAKAGIEIDDIILEFDGKKITKEHKLPRMVAETPVGKKVDIVLLSKGKKKTVSIILAEMEKESDQANSEEMKGNNHPTSKSVLGMNLSELSMPIRKKISLPEEVSGLYISDIQTKSEPEKAGLKVGDAILHINQHPTKTIEDFTLVLNNAIKLGRKTILLKIYRKKNMFYVQLPISKH